jgi:hypothetical protein
MSRIDVFYGRTDGTPGYKEYSCVVVRTTETGQLRYYGDLYEPMAGCNYKVLYEVDMNKLSSLLLKSWRRDTKWSPVDPITSQGPCA